MARSCLSVNRCQYRHGHARLEQRRESGGLGRRHVHGAILDADELRGSQQRERAVATGTFTPSQSLTFAGIEMRIDGTPAAGDTFTVTPSAQRDMFATLDRLIAARRMGPPAIPRIERNCTATSASAWPISTTRSRTLSTCAARSARACARSISRKR